MNIKENENIKIKVASPENAAELLEIYKFYVEKISNKPEMKSFISIADYSRNKHSKEKTG